MKSKHQIATLLSLFLFLAPPLFSQHLRLVVFAATSAEDKGFAQGIKVSVSELRTLFGRLDTPELPLDSTFFIGDQFNIDQLENWLKTVDTHPDDFLIFYFLGHGNESSKSQYPQLIFHKDHELARRDMKKNTRNLEDIYMTLFEEHPTRGLLVIGDACNDPIEKAKTEAMSGSRKKKPKTPFRKSPDGDLSGCSTFLQESLSSLAISSSDKGNKAYLSKTEGSFFTQAFVQTMNTDCAKVPKDLSELFYKTAQVVDAIAADYDLEQKLIVDNPTKSKFNFKRMVQRIFFDGNDRRLMNKAFRNDDYSYFDVILGKTKSPETEQKIREQFLSKKPAAYYILSAITKAEKLATDSDLEKEAEVLLDYCTARAIYQSNKGLKTERDINIVKKLRKLDEEYEQLGISDYVNPGKWLDAKCIECKQGFEEKREQVLRLVDSLEREIISTQQAIVTLDSQEISVKKEIEALERELAAKDQSIKKTIQTITENGNIRVSIPEFPANFSANLQAALQAVIEGREVDTGSLTEYEKVWLSQVEVIYEPNEEMSPNVEDEIDLQAFAVGDHCSPRIINYTNTVLQSLLA
ncbi:MAG: caspase family protein, partial [Phaeodactylibacter sp.]|nr:caspase family protein [Phaeodactylibacter sp.]